MPTITAITPQKKSGRFNLFLDGNFAFGIESETLLSTNLKVGKIISAEAITEIVKKEQGTKLLDLATNFLSYRPRSEKEVKDYLTKKIAQKENIKFALAAQSPMIGQTIAKLKRYKYLDDREFAKWFVTSRTSSHPKGSMVIRLELKRKGIADDLITKTLSGLLNETDLAKKAVEKKVKRWANLPPMDFKKKFYVYLASRGFDYETIKDTFAFFKKKS